MYPDQAFIDAYAGVEIHLPNRPPIRCRPLTISAVAGMLPLLRRHADNDEEALFELLRAMPNHLKVSRRERRVVPKSFRMSRRSRRTLHKLRGMEALKVLERLLGAAEGDNHKQKRQANKAAKVNLLDSLYDFENAYGYRPPPDLPWVLFMAGVARTQRYESRRIANVMTGTRWAIGVSFAKDAALQQQGRQVMESAYPQQNGTKDEGPGLFLVDDPSTIDEVMKTKAQEKKDD